MSSRQFAPSVRLSKSSIYFRGSKHLITFDPGARAEIWTPLSKMGGVQITTLEVESGGGKSTLASELHTFLQEQARSRLKFGFERHVTASEYSSAFIPQKVDLILHWRAKNILPKNSEFLSAFFDEKDIFEKIEKAHLSNFSGGQVARIFTCSAVERLYASGVGLNYLILDEAFEGIDAGHANRILRQLVKRWGQLAPDRSLFLLLISHLDVEELSRGIDVRRLRLVPAKAEEKTDRNGNTYTETVVEVVDAGKVWSA